MLSYLIYRKADTELRKNDESIRLESARASAPGDLKDSILPQGKSFEDSANIFSLWYMSFLNNLLRTGTQHTLLHSDLGPINKTDSCADVEKRFEHFWEIERKKPLQDQSLWLVLWRTCGWGMVIEFFLLYLLYGGILFGPPLILNELVSFLQGTKTLSTGLLWLLIVLIFVLPMTGTLKFYVF